MKDLKLLWQNLQWILPVVALAMSVFTWYHKTNQNKIDISLGRLEAMTAILLEDVGIMKKYVTDEAHHERVR